MHLVNRVHTALEGANRKLAAVATASRGVAGRAILAALLAGETDPVVLAELARGPLRKQRPPLEQALRGHLRRWPHQSFVLTELLAQIDRWEERIARFTAPMQATCAQEGDEAAVVAWLDSLARQLCSTALLDGIPGLCEATAQGVGAEIGTDRGRCPSAAALAAGAGRAPGHDESAGRQRSGRTRTGNVWRHTILVPAAHAAAHPKHTALAARYRRIAARRIAARRGHKKAVVALAHALLVSISHVLGRRQPSHELGEDSFQHRGPVARAKRFVPQLTHLGFEVQPQPQPTPASIAGTPVPSGSV